MYGTYTALITPFQGGKIDEISLCKNISFQINEGVEGVLILGSTGEGELITDQERYRIIEIASNETKGKVPFWVNCGDINADFTIRKIKEAQHLGAAGVLIAPPCYVLPNQEGLYNHFKSITLSTNLPVMLYNHPRRTGVSISIKTLKRLAKLPNIIGIKDASKDIGYIGEMINEISDFIIMSGDDICTLAYLSMGAKGVFSVVSNAMPKKICKFVKNPTIEQYKELFPFFQFSQCETNPIPIKAMMHQMGMSESLCRLPLTPLKEEHQKIMEDLLSIYA